MILDEKATLVIDRSTELQTVALAADGAVVREETFDGVDCRSGEWIVRVLGFLDGIRPRRIAVGTGPGSFAGIRAALAFAQGWSIGAPECEVVGLPSPCALSRDEGPLAVVGDARRGRFWVALFDGREQVGGIFQTDGENLPLRIPLSAPVVSPDAKRIGSVLAEVFAERYDENGGVPTASGLARAFLANPSLLKSEPLPVYLNPAVRD